MSTNMRRALAAIATVLVGLIVYPVILAIVNTPVADEAGNVTGRLGDYSVEDLHSR